MARNVHVVMIFQAQIFLGTQGKYTWIFQGVLKDDKGCCNTSSLKVETAPELEDAYDSKDSMSFRLCGRPLFKDFSSIEMMKKYAKSSAQKRSSNSSPLKNDDWKTMIVSS